MVVLVGYSIAGLCIVVVGRSRWILGCLGKLVLCQVPATTVAGQATTRQFVLGADSEQYY